jgi:hypothetical protein
MGRDVQQWLHGQLPPGAAGRRLGKCRVNDLGGRRVIATKRQCRCLAEGRVDDPAALAHAASARRRRNRSSCFTQRCQRDVGKRVDGHAFDGALKREACVGKTILTQSKRADGVPGVGATLTAIQMARRFERELGGEILERPIVVAARKVNETAQPVEADGAEPCVLALTILYANARSQLPLGLVGEIRAGASAYGERSAAALLPSSRTPTGSDAASCPPRARRRGAAPQPRRDDCRFDRARIPGWPTPRRIEDRDGILHERAPPRSQAR